VSGYERSDANVRSLTISVAGLLVLLAVALLAMGWMFSYLARSDRPEPQASPLSTGRELPPAPRLQTTPADDLAKTRQAEQRILNSYGWVDAKEKIVRIPIDRAIELTAERGLPVRRQPPPKAAPSKER
jgi:hypothetical protein